MKKILALFIIALQMALLVPPTLGQYTPGEKRKLLVTAYYSPLPGQRFYIRGSLEADIRLNGRGTNGADGTEVFTGMLAAPSSYPFGTRIDIPGLGVGEVHDRGGAIVAHAGYDRIDVWMGSGEAGLARALNWGARMVEGEVWFRPYEAEPGLSFAHVPSELSDSLIARMQKYTALATSYAFSKPAEKATPEEIKDLQVSLTLFGFYSGPIDGELSPAAKEAILLFQLEEGIIHSEDDAGAGHFGPTTRQTLREKAAAYDRESAQAADRLAKNRSALTAGLGKNASGESVEVLQRMLWELGYYHGPVSRRYDRETIDAVFAFQQKNGILSTAYDTGAGYFGKQTYTVMVAAIERRIEKVKEYPKEMQTWIPARPVLPKLDALSPAMATLKIPALNFNLAASGAPEKMMFAEDLQLNDEGPAVKKLQAVLMREGYLAAGLDTGYFGNQTKNALVAFQTAHGLEGAGRVGPQTRNVLNAI